VDYFLHVVIYAIVIAKFLSKNTKPAPLRIMRALSCHKIETHNHKLIPIIEQYKSIKAYSGTPRIDIATRTKTLATHLIYQSKVCLGVADLNIRLEFSNSSGAKSLDSDKLNPRSKLEIRFLYFR
jgi:hypothetical protein